MIDNFDSIYNDMILSNYSESDIKLYFLIKYNIDYKINKKRYNQEEFREQLLERYKKCILTGSTSSLEACHIISYSESNNMDIDNGIILNATHHKLFDNYIISINPKTLEIEINDKLCDIKDAFIMMIKNKRIDILEKYPNTIKNLEYHYKKYLFEYRI